MNLPQAKPTIFLADDDPDEQKLLRNALERLTDRHHIRVAIHGKHLLDLLSVSTNRELPCLVILDNNMPVLDGKETLRQLRNNRRYRNIPVVIYSASGSVFDKEEFLSMGAAVYLRKADTIQGIMEAGKAMLEHCHEPIFFPVL